MHIYFGAHTSIAGGVLNGLKYITSIGGNVSQIFLGNKLSAQLKMKTKISDQEKKEIRQYLNDNDMKLFVHASYILNLASMPPSSSAIQYQLDSLRYDLELGDEIGSSGLVIHLGNMMKLDENEAYDNMAKCVMKVIDTSKGNGRILLETSAGAGTQIGVGLNDFARLWNMFPKSYHSRLGVCVDTAHIFSAGIEINKTEEIKKYFVDFNHLIGIKHLYLVHLNDSKAPLNARVDRHENLTEGYIFDNEKGGDIKALQTILNFLVKYHIPALLETPDQSNYQYQIELIKSLVHSYMKLPKPSINLMTQSLRTKINKLTTKVKQTKKITKSYDNQSAGMSTFATIEPNKKIISLLMELGDLLKIEKDFFRSRALQTASIILREYDQKIENAEQLKGLSRIGQGIRDKVREILETGTMEELEMLRRRGPQKKSLRSTIMEELEGVLGIGPQEAKRLMKIGVKSIEDLEAKVANGTIELNHQQMIGLKYRKDLNIDIPRKDAHKIVTDIEKIINSNSRWKDLEIIHAGSYPSGKVASKDIDILMFDPRIITREDLRKSTVLIDVVKFLEDKNKILETLSLGSTKFLGIVPPSNTKQSNYAMHLDIRLIPTESRVTAYFFYTSGGKFNQMIRQVAKDKGFMLSEFELKDKKGESIPLSREEDIFTALGIDFIPMEDRRAI
jgi:apurinic endonuclease APN1